jgi:hypothetical protein
MARPDSGYIRWQLVWEFALLVLWPDQEFYSLVK